MFRKAFTAGVATIALAGIMTVSFSNDAEAQRWRRGHRGGHGAAVAAGVVGALALGAIAAQAARPRPEVIEGGCYWQRRRVWDDYNGVWRVRRVRVCD